MESNKSKVSSSSPCPSYSAGPPWMFKGRAMYQLHLVKSEVARKLIPKELKLVEAFGYTLGGMFLAHYDDSPAGRFDELVVIAGTVWNPPTSCAWATRVLVSSKDACDHGRKEIGLPSHFASFSQRKSVIGDNKRRGSTNSWKSQESRQIFDMEIGEVEGSRTKPLCNINKMVDLTQDGSQGIWKTPMISIALPSFSGRTHYQPGLLKYSCNMDCSVRMVQPAKVMAPGYKTHHNLGQHVDSSAQDLVMSVLLSKPILSIMLDNMKLHVKAPSFVVYDKQQNHEQKLVKNWSLFPRA